MVGAQSAFKLRDMAVDFIYAAAVVLASRPDF